MNPEPSVETRIEACWSILLMLQMFMILLRLGVIALGVRLIVSLSSATDGVLLPEES